MIKVNSFSLWRPFVAFMAFLLPAIPAGLACSSTPAPTAIFSTDCVSGTAPLQVHLSDNSTGQIDSWEWDFNGDEVPDSTERDAIYTFSQPGTFTVSLKVTGPGGTDNDTRTISVSTPASGDGDEWEDREPVAAQAVIFDVGYMNWAWGYQAEAYYVDNRGNVWRMKSPSKWSDEYRNAVEGKQDPILYDADSLEQSYVENRDSLVCRIDTTDLRDMVDLIEALGRGNYSPRTNTGCDMGGQRCGCLRYDASADKYEKIILSESGDWSFYNLDPNAVALRDRLAASLHESGCSVLVLW